MTGCNIRLHAVLALVPSVAKLLHASFVVGSISVGILIGNVGVLCSQELPKEEKVKRLLSLFGVEAQMHQMAGQLNQLFVQVIQVKNPNMSADQLGEVGKIINKEVSSAIPELIKSGEENWINAFSTEEVDRLYDFYNSDSGRTILSKLQIVQQRLGSEGQTFGRTVVAPRIINAIKNNERTKSVNLE